MIQLSSDTVILLSCEEEIAASYVRHQPAPGQFSLQQPFQASNTRLAPTRSVSQNIGRSSALQVAEETASPADDLPHGGTLRPSPPAAMAVLEIPAERQPGDVGLGPCVCREADRQSDSPQQEAQPRRRKRKHSAAIVYQPNVQVCGDF